ncbi:ATP-dependent 6-phosphofructokinase [Dissulfurirhabdus thermomarina]|uniref:ATP-dependent 6-phosphofructokinase n=1 Tax=Dissulfurirhabdus thermomarina TaxID=1765737 RepID=A0A6N9TN52_DISTH|nr:ATP-dependent 6-phosphofructokinase [Dissulfurirhabdus thermomarina]NDY42732.1 ATP-dependent 6-phosphofructokinase [Dissulfurirhabdus thermomarina]NMX22561.1 ATP-dependent 6-phosphofructokinase [Dissulfurirhabdus thermomarina]
MNEFCHTGEDTRSEIDLLEDIGLDESVETAIPTLGAAKVPSPLIQTEQGHFVSDDNRVLVNVSHRCFEAALKAGRTPPSFELAGPRRHIYFDPTKLRCAIVTAGGLCPGINDVIRAIVLALYHGYGVRSTFGIRYGLRGFIPEYGLPVMELTPERVERIHEYGGTILGSSRGHQPIEGIVDALERMHIGVLFLIGGDGTFRAGAKVVEEIQRRQLKISVVAIPKTIDNDIYLVFKTFGFDTAVQMACEAIRSAHTEAVGAPNGIGLVKLMGRHSGFIAATATNALREVNFCLIPEADFVLEGEGGLLQAVEQRIRQRGHAVVVVAEGAGQRYVRGDKEERDASGNIKLGDIGVFLRDRFRAHFAEVGLEVNLRYIDPSYIIRSVPANVDDSLYCANLGQNAVHAAMAGKTGLMVSHWNGRYVHVPIKEAIKRRKRINLNSRFWMSVLESTGQFNLAVHPAETP